MVMPIPVAVVAAEQDVLTAAGWVVNSYRATGGYTVPLSINLRNLGNAVDAWRKAMHSHSLDSDTNGFIAGEGGYNNAQSESSSNGRRGCASASGEEDSSDKAESERAVRPNSAA